MALVDGDVLDTDEVFTSRDALLDGPLKLKSQSMSHMH